MIVMVHCSLTQVGWTEGGPIAVIRALMDAIKPEGTLVMPAESPRDPAENILPCSIRKPHRRRWGPWQKHFEPIRERCGATIRWYPCVPMALSPPRLRPSIRSEFCEGLGTPFDKLYELDAWTLLLGVGFNRCTSLHYAESLVPARRTSVSRFLVVESSEPVWVEMPDMAADNGVHFPIVGQRFIDGGDVRVGRVGLAQAMLCSTRALVDHARAYFTEVLT